MGTQKPYLNDMFAEARRETPVVSEDEINTLLDRADLHGRQRITDEKPGKTGQNQLSRTTRTTIMGSIAVLMIGGLIGVGTFFTSPKSEVNLQQGPVMTILPESPTIRSTAPEAAPLAAGPATTPAEGTTLSGTFRPATEEQIAGRDKEKNGIVIDTDDSDDETGRKISEELHKLIENYWVDKINEYKRFIDRSISASDRTELDRFRVRWNVLDKDDESSLNFGLGMGMHARTNDGTDAALNAGLAMKRKKHGSADVSLHADSDGNNAMEIATSDGNGNLIMRFNADSEVSIEGDEGQETKVKNRVIIMEGAQSAEVDPEGPEVSDGSKQTVRKEIRIKRLNNDSEEVEEEKIVIENAEAKSMKIEVNDGEIHLQPMVGMIKSMIEAEGSESSRILVGTWGIAERNREAMDELKVTLKKDIDNFVSMVRERLVDIVEQHGDEVPEEMRHLLADKAENADRMFESGEFMKSVEPLYEVIFEPMIMLYNGSDISDVLSSTIAEPVAGITLEANSTLKQSYPNPAGSKATIDFTLQEASPATTLRLFDATGSEVRRIDLGSVGAGDHSAQLDVADLQTGTYLYHLTIQTSDGEQVFSKKMQVVR